MDKSILVKILGFPATLIHGCPGTLDRWLWLKKRLPKTLGRVNLLDIGCGSGAYTIGFALKGYSCLGISSSSEKNKTARERANICKAHNARFEFQDIAKLDDRQEFIGMFDVIICMEVIEHIFDDQGLMNHIGAFLKKGGRLFLSTAYYNQARTGPKPPIDLFQKGGGHLRWGYDEAGLRALSDRAGLEVEEISFCYGFLSRKLTVLHSWIAEKNEKLAWVIILPLRIIPPLLDRIVTNALKRDWYSICLVARKP